MSVETAVRPAETPAGSTTFEPNLIGFTCNWCSYRAADLAGTSRIKYPPNVRLLRLMCSGRLDPTFVLKALSSGADGVLITGCWPGDCHYMVQNHYAQRRFLLLRRTLEELGVEPARVKLVWASAAEGLRLANEMTKFIEEVRVLGPLGWKTPAAIVEDELDGLELAPEQEPDVSGPDPGGPNLSEPAASAAGPAAATAEVAQ